MLIILYISLIINVLLFALIFWQNGFWGNLLEPLHRRFVHYTCYTNHQQRDNWQRTFLKRFFHLIIFDGEVKQKLSLPIFIMISFSTILTFCLILFLTFSQ